MPTSDLLRSICNQNLQCNLNMSLMFSLLKCVINISHCNNIKSQCHRFMRIILERCYFQLFRGLKLFLHPWPLIGLKPQSRLDCLRSPSSRYNFESETNKKITVPMNLKMLSLSSHSSIFSIHSTKDEIILRLAHRIG